MSIHIQSFQVFLVNCDSQRLKLFFIGRFVINCSINKSNYPRCQKCSFFTKITAENMSLELGTVSTRCRSLTPRAAIWKTDFGSISGAISPASCHFLYLSLLSLRQIVPPSGGGMGGLPALIRNNHCL